MSGTGSILFFRWFLYSIFGKRIFLLIGGVLGRVLALVLVVTPALNMILRWLLLRRVRGAENLNFLVEDLPVLTPVASQTTSRDGEYTRFQQSLRGPAVATVLIKMDGILESLNHKTVFRGQSDQLLTAAEVSSPVDAWCPFRAFGGKPRVCVCAIAILIPEFGTKMLRSLVKISDQLIVWMFEDVDARIERVKARIEVYFKSRTSSVFDRLLMAEERRQMLFVHWNALCVDWRCDG